MFTRYINLRSQRYSRGLDTCLNLSCLKLNVFGNVKDVLNEENLKLTFGVDFVCKEIKSFQLLQ